MRLSVGLGLLCAACVNGQAFVHLFEWSWKDIAMECEQYLGPMGYDAVQTSPQMEHIQGGQWWTRYQPVSYNTQSRSGGQQDFQDMVKRCQAVGVKVYADPVPNHFAGGSGTGIGGSTYGGRYYPGANYGPNDFHHNDGDTSQNCQVNNYQDKFNVQHCDLDGLPDIDTGADYVSKNIANYLNTLKSYGVVGFRIDAAKHQDDNEMANYLSQAGNPWVFQEVIYGNNEAVQPEMYVHNGNVTEFRWADLVANSVKNGNFNALGNIGNGILPSSAAVNFLDNHDTQRGGAPLTYKDGDVYRVANYFMLAHPYGYPKVMSSYYFTDHDQGPPSTPVHDGTNVNCFAGKPWVCEHRWQGIGGLVNWRKTASGEGVDNWNPQGNKVSFNRGNKAFIAINQGTDVWKVTLQTGLPAGDYCDVIQYDYPANCKTVTVDSNGNANVNMAGRQAVAMHIKARPQSRPILATN